MADRLLCRASVLDARSLSVRSGTERIVGETMSADGEWASASSSQWCSDLGILVVDVVLEMISDFDFNFIRPFSLTVG